MLQSYACRTSVPLRLTRSRYSFLSDLAILFVLLWYFILFLFSIYFILFYFYFILFYLFFIFIINKCIRYYLFIPFFFDVYFFYFRFLWELRVRIFYRQRKTSTESFGPKVLQVSR